MNLTKMRKASARTVPDRWTVTVNMYDDDYEVRAKQKAERFMRAMRIKHGECGGIINTYSHESWDYSKQLFTFEFVKAK